MKFDNIALIAAAGAGLFLIYRAANGYGLDGKKPAPTSTGTARVNAVEVNNTATPGTPGWGWKYYTDGTSIGPDGRYYSGGTEVYNPLGILGASQ